MDHKSPSPTGPVILIISYAFFPENEIGARRTTALATFLVARGYRVVVVSSFGNHNVQPGSQIMPGVFAVPIKRPSKVLINAIVTLKQKIVSRTRTKRGPAVGIEPETTAATTVRSDILKDAFFRLICFVDEFKRWSWRASRAAADAARQHSASLLISSGPPHSALLAGVVAARKLRIPYVADLRDPWTDCVTANPHRRFDYWLQKPFEKWVIRNAACVTSAGATVAELLAKRYPDASAKITSVPNGYDGNGQSVSTHTGGKLSILFAGELYLGRNPFPVLDALERLLHRTDVDADLIRITFMGRVAQYAGRSLSEWLLGKRLSRIMTIFPHRPLDEVNRAVKAATVLLNLAQQQPYSVPAKTYEHLISGREILLVCENESETARVVKGIRGVNQVDPRYSEGLERALFDLYRRHAIDGQMIVPSMDDVRKFSRCAANEKFIKIIENVLRLECKKPG